MSIYFEGKTFNTKKAWLDAFPAYNSRHLKHVIAGSTTIAQLEQKLGVAKAEARKLASASAKKQTDRMIKRKGARR